MKQTLAAGLPHISATVDYNNFIDIPTQVAPAEVFGFPVLLPLAIGINIDFVSLVTTCDPHIYIGGDNNVFWKPMSWAIIYGLTFATFLTLVIVPVMYWWMNKMTYNFSGKLKQKQILTFTGTTFMNLMAFIC